MKNTTNVYTKWQSVDKELFFYSIEEILDIGTPIDSDGAELELIDNNLFCFVDGAITQLK